MISTFAELLKEAAQQDQPQRMLFLFIKSEAKKNKNKHKTGTLTPLMCVDKLPEDIKDFASFSKEADSISKDWDMMMIAGLNGENGKPPSEDDAEPYLNQMANNVSDGNDISNYVIFDRDEKPVVMQTR
jgi:hypothetical protein